MSACELMPHDVGGARRLVWDPESGVRVARNFYDRQWNTAR